MTQGNKESALAARAALMCAQTLQPADFGCCPRCSLISHLPSRACPAAICDLLGKHRCLGKELSPAPSDAGPAGQPGLAHRPKRDDRSTFPALAPVLASPPAFHHSFLSSGCFVQLPSLQTPRSPARVAQPPPGKAMEGLANVT